MAVGTVLVVGVGMGDGGDGGGSVAGGDSFFVLFLRTLFFFCTCVLLGVEGVGRAALGIEGVDCADRSTFGIADCVVPSFDTMRS